MQKNLSILAIQIHSHNTRSKENTHLEIALNNPLARMVSGFNAVLGHLQ